MPKPKLPKPKKTKPKPSDTPQQDTHNPEVSQNPEPNIKKEDPRDYKKLKEVVNDNWNNGWKTKF